MKKILLATDGSDCSVRAAKAVGELAATMPAAQVTVLHVAHVPNSFYVTDENGNSVTPEVPMDVMIRRSADPILRRTVAALGLPADKVFTEVQVGEPAEEIVDLAKCEGYDMVVMGNRGLSQLKELLIGSVSNRVLHLAPCPVLIVK
ncbi:MAG TPA: universal stress protein [Symbiobacteriaceae bacterium]|jgi:nucleotide-binding universal stress UspA family protein